MTDDLDLVAMMLCKACREGVGGECHTPGCALWMSQAPDVPPRLEETAASQFTPDELTLIVTATQCLQGILETWATGRRSEIQPGDLQALRALRVKAASLAFKEVARDG
jgi:hypothetical protein